MSSETCLKNYYLNTGNKSLTDLLKCNFLTCVMFHWFTVSWRENQNNLLAWRELHDVVYPRSIFFLHSVYSISRLMRRCNSSQFDKVTIGMLILNKPAEMFAVYLRIYWHLQWAISFFFFLFNQKLAGELKVSIDWNREEAVIELF